MALFRRKPKQDPGTTTFEVGASLYGGDVPLEVKGESRYQAALATIAGPKTEEGYDLPIYAVLAREPDNDYDPNAIAVYVTTTDGTKAARKVGYIAREMAHHLAPALDQKAREGETVALEGRIRGGWRRGGWDPAEVDEGSYGVWLVFDPADFGLSRSDLPVRPTRREAAHRNSVGPDTSSVESRWMDALPTDSLAAIKKLRKLLSTETNPIERHFMYLELERLLYKSRDVFDSALDDFERACRAHDSEMDTIAPALREFFGGTPALPTYKQAAIMEQKRHNFEAALWWAERGLAIYGEDGLRDDHVQDLKSRAAKYRQKLGR